MKSLIDMTDDEIELYIQQLRLRRSHAEALVKAHRIAAANARSGSLKERLTRQLELAQKNLDAVNKQLAKLEERVNSITALRLQSGDLQLDELATLTVKEESDE